MFAYYPYMYMYTRITVDSVFFKIFFFNLPSAGIRTNGRTVFFIVFFWYDEDFWGMQLKEKKK
jgi:hypothetical protein